MIPFLFLSANYTIAAKCSYTRHLPAAVTQRPTCELDGSFAAKQCKGDMVSGRFVSHEWCDEVIVREKGQDHITSDIARGLGGAQMFLLQRDGRTDIRLGMAERGGRNDVR